MNISKTHFLLLFVFCAHISLASTPAKTSNLASVKPTAAEKKYFKTRDGLRSIALGDNTGNADASLQSIADPVSELNRQIKGIVGPVSMQGLPKEGEADAEDFFPTQEEGSSLAGVKFSKDNNESLFATTKGLVSEFLSTHPKFPKSLQALSRTTQFYDAAIGNGAALTNYATIPLKTSPRKDYTYAFLGGFSQDYGTYVPDTIIMLTSRGRRIFIYYATAKIKPTAIPACAKIWDKYSAKAEKQQDDKLRDKGFSAYSECYRERAKNQPFFPALVKETQSIIKRLPQR